MVDRVSPVGIIHAFGGSPPSPSASRFSDGRGLSGVDHCHWFAKLIVASFYFVLRVYAHPFCALGGYWLGTTVLEAPRLRPSARAVSECNRKICGRWDVRSTASMSCRRRCGNGRHPLTLSRPGSLSCEGWDAERLQHWSDHGRMDHESGPWRSPPGHPCRNPHASSPSRLIPRQLCLRRSVAYYQPIDPFPPLAAVRLVSCFAFHTKITSSSGQAAFLSKTCAAATRRQ